MAGSWSFICEVVSGVWSVVRRERCKETFHHAEAMRGVKLVYGRRIVLGDVLAEHVVELRGRAAARV